MDDDQVPLELLINRNMPVWVGEGSVTVKQLEGIIKMWQSLLPTYAQGVISQNVQGDVYSRGADAILTPLASAQELLTELRGTSHDYRNLAQTYNSLSQVSATQGLNRAGRTVHPLMYVRRCAAALTSINVHDRTPEDNIHLIVNRTAILTYTNDGIGAIDVLSIANLVDPNHIPSPEDAYLFATALADLADFALLRAEQEDILRKSLSYLRISARSEPSFRNLAQLGMVEYDYALVCEARVDRHTFLHKSRYHLEQALASQECEETRRLLEQVKNDMYSG